MVGIDCWVQGETFIGAAAKIARSGWAGMKYCFCQVLERELFSLIHPSHSLTFLMLCGHSAFIVRTRFLRCFVVRLFICKTSDTSKNA